MKVFIKKLCDLKNFFPFLSLPISFTWYKNNLFSCNTNQLTIWWEYVAYVSLILTVKITNDNDVATRVTVGTVCFSIYGFCILWSLQKNPLWKGFSIDSNKTSPITKNINDIIFRIVVTCSLNAITKMCYFILMTFWNIFLLLFILN